MASISFDQFRDTLTAAVARRNHNYNNVCSMSIRWEQDDTKAVKDSNHFQRMLKDLHFEPATELIIRHNDFCPGLTLQKSFLGLVEKCNAKTESDRTLMILHYAGHSIVKNGSFTFAETRNAEKTLNADTLLNNLKDSTMISEAMRLDVLVILDCCYAHVATRSPNVPHRVVEVMAATSTQTPLVRFPPDNTFTAKLAGEIGHRKRSGHKNVEFADVFQSLISRAGKVRPTHALLVGVSSVLLPLNGPRTVDPADILPDYKALFSVSVSNDLTADELRQLSAWMRNLPPFAGLELDAVYPTQSMCLIMRSAMSVFAKLYRLEGYSLIAENRAPPLNLDLIMQPGLFSASPKKENTPFKKET
ncbi:hypothetical protein BDW42DRAFT_91330 [Aspergillus taichungensis]|uniref:Peptidase C14 caspase domain-containing protein n=1 Tax=Aspergillus taichungensis TaxID=482145 RepID=A0A2J5HWB1_9EURO|nr:hypothetical protein BDW42DRAFT_91330 [Aspergillus taichungensis]